MRDTWRRSTVGLRAEPALLALVVAAGAVYVAFALIRWNQLAASAFDLGIFDQTVWHYSRFELPANSVRSLDNIWGDHFSPVLVLLAPLYWIADDARALLVSQAVLLAAAAVPIFLYARDLLGRVPAYLLAAAYLGFWGVQSGLAWDFHELAFAPLALGLVLLTAARRQWRGYFLALLALLCVKEDMSIVAVSIGVYLLTFADARRQGLATIGAGVLWYVLVVRLLIPHYSPSGDYGYWTYDAFGDSPLPAIWGAITHPGLVFETLFGDGTKRETLLALFAPFLGLCLFSRTAILLLPLVAQRFLSTNTQYWSTDYHYTLTMAAILFVGAADGLATIRRLLPGSAQRFVAPAGAAVILIANLGFLAATDGRTGGAQKLSDVAKRSSYVTSPYVEAAAAAVALVPDGASVAAQDNVVARLTQRETAVVLTSGSPPTDYVVANVLDSSGRGVTLNGGFANLSRGVGRVLETHVPVGFAGGWLVLRSRALPPVARAPSLAPIDEEAAADLRTAYRAWSASAGAYASEVVQCGADAACLRPLGGAYRRDQAGLERELARVQGGLAVGCAELHAPAVSMASELGRVLDVTESAGIAGDGTGYAAGAARLAELNAVDAAGFVTRFVALCAPAS